MSLNREAQPVPNKSPSFFALPAVPAGFFMPENTETYLHATKSLLQPMVKQGLNYLDILLQFQWIFA
jgi:hypothetical protein